MEQDKEVLNKEFANFSYTNFPKNPTIHQRNAFFISTNGYSAYNDISQSIADLYIEASHKNSSEYGFTILIICMCCVFVTLVASVILIPTLFKLDQEQEEIVSKWLRVEYQAKLKAIECIENFNLIK